MEANSMNLTLQQQVFPSGVIVQSLHSESNGLVESHSQRLNEWICDTREKMVREALIALGWTPPDELTQGDANDCRKE